MLQQPKMGNQDDEITVLPPTYEKADQVLEERETSIGESFSDDRTEPTDEELATLRRVSENIPLRAW
jgi:hypothetical protein